FNEYLISLILLSLTITACRSDKSRVLQTEDSDEAIVNETIKKIKQIKKVFYLSPSPAEMLGVIDVAELEFNEMLPNPVENADKYFDSRSQALNLGIYITDLAYCALFERHEETVDYLKVSQIMTDKMHVSGAIDREMIDRAESNIEHLDSLFNISNEAFVNLLTYCEKNQRSNTMVLLSAGAFIESLYLAVNLAGEYKSGNHLFQHLADQKFVIDNLMEYAESNSADPNVARTWKDLQPLKSIFNQLEKTESLTTLKKDESNHLVFGGGINIEMSEKDYYNIKKTTNELRNKIISNENE
ncbi:MAG: hypothetical protein KAT15_24965, partial [Bacteroidales bacterium]|nr:hypothetical protein [Bacteroidales bacterium]